MGSAAGEMSGDIVEKAYILGQEIARNDCAIITGGCPGLPYAATQGAKSRGGVTIGISPGLNLNEHVQRYGSPTTDIDVLIYTGSGLMGREVTAIRSCDIVIIIGGRSGTLGEFSIAYDEGKLIGVLEGTGGITEIIQDLVEKLKKPTGSKVVYSSNPKELIEKLLELYREEYY
ncbi:MAG: LOG family protein [Candidatus Schekmanbacteria bacterium]|nr:LOG family protein [Candidatus Schekmanbacteria bacterium]